jgi:hypothetical protein
MSKIKLQIDAIGLNTKIKRIWNHLIGKSRKQISDFFARMNNERSVSFLKFMHKIILIDKSVDYVQECLKHYQTILMCCPRMIMTYFLLEIDPQFVVELLEQRDDFWIRYFVGLIQIGYMKDLDDLVMTHLRRIYHDDYILTLIKLLIREVSNENFPVHIRQYIFDYICTSPIIVLFLIPRENEEEPATFEELIDRIDDWSLTFPQWMIDEFRFVPELPQQPQPEHQAVDAEAFVCRTFASLHPLDPNHVYQCGICYCSPDDTNEDDTNEDRRMKVFRLMNCCPQQMCCHNCLVHQATACNTPDRESKNTRVFICPYARCVIPFFPPNP